MLRRAARHLPVVSRNSKTVYIAKRRRVASARTHRHTTARLIRLPDGRRRRRRRRQVHALANPIARQSSLKRARGGTRAALIETRTMGVCVCVCFGPIGELEGVGIGVTTARLRDAVCSRSVRKVNKRCVAIRKPL